MPAKQLITYLFVCSFISSYSQVDSSETCIQYSHMYPELPKWGVTGERSDLTENLMCCLSQPETTTSSSAGGEDAERYRESVSKFHPHLYDRGHGWFGQTYEAALDFCKNIEGYELCSYDAICPVGAEKEPVSSYEDHDGPEAWAPIIDDANDWVQISRINSCIKYSALNPDPPEWGYNGIDNEEVTRNVLCCAKSGMPGVESENAIVVEPAGPLYPPPHPAEHSHTVGVGPHSKEEDQLIAQIATAYRPKWYDRQQGWEGQSYPEAIQFCASDEVRKDSGGTAAEGMTYGVCPYIAICPLGHDTEPLGGFREGPSGSWVPIKDGSNQWVQVSSENSCERYGAMNEDPNPAWGLTGEDDEELTRHVACCVVQDTPLTIGGGASAEEIAAKDADAEYFIMAEKYRPEWHTREIGWDGTKYIDAVAYCQSSNTKEAYNVCPLEAICVSYHW